MFLLVTNNYLFDCNLAVLHAAYTGVWDTWSASNILPEYNKFYFIQSGEGEICIDGVTYHPKAGDLMLLPANRVQSYRTIPGNTYVKYWCHFNANVVNTPLFNLIETPYIVHYDKVLPINNMFKKIIDNYQKEDILSVLTAKTELAQILLSFFHKTGNNLKEYSDEQKVVLDRIQIIKKFVYDNIKENITLQMLADTVHFNPNYFVTYFKKQYKITPMKFVQLLRVEKSKELIVNTDLSINEIAYMMGFSDAAHLSNRFKKQVGYTPIEYRKMN